MEKKKKKHFVVDKRITTFVCVVNFIIYFTEVYMNTKNYVFCRTPNCFYCFYLLFFFRPISSNNFSMLLYFSLRYWNRYLFGFDFSTIAQVNLHYFLLLLRPLFIFNYQPLYHLEYHLKNHYHIESR